jgi:pimeloyl-ACP methyl ester carboxylesterase
MTDYSITTKLDSREEHFRIPGPREGLSLFLRFLPAANASSARPAVLYVHGATFPCRSRDPAGVKTPLGPFSEIIRAWHGQLGYDPGNVRVPIAIIRGEWDGLIPDEDARWLFDAFSQAPIKRDIKISRGTHLMHLEAMRLSLWRESINFLAGEDVAPVPV